MEENNTNLGGQEMADEKGEGEMPEMSEVDGASSFDKKNQSEMDANGGASGKLGMEKWKPILIVIAVLGVIFLLYRLFFTGGGSSNQPVSGDKYFSDDFAEYAIGSDATAFIIFRNNNDSQTFFSDINVNLEGFVEGLVLFKKGALGEKSLAMLRFETEESAKKVKELIGKSGGPFGNNMDIKGNVLILKENSDMEDFGGSFYDNPNLVSLNNDWKESQIIISADIEKFPEANLGFLLMQQLTMMGVGMEPFTMINEEDRSVGFELVPVARAQGIKSAIDNPGTIRPVLKSEGEEAREKLLDSFLTVMRFAKSNTMYVKITDSSVQVGFAVELVAKEDLEKYAGFNEADEETKEEYLKDGGLYDEGFNTLKNSLEENEKALNDMVRLPSGANIKLELNGLSFFMSSSVQIKDVKDFIGLAQSNLDTSSRKARDVARIGGLNKISTSIEVGYLDTGSYPQKSACVENLGIDAKDYGSGLPPTDPKGEQFFAGETCESGYYYQWIEGEGYILWAKMEVGKYGNIGVGPEDVADNFDNFKPTSEGGAYYALFMEAEPSGLEVPGGGGSAIKRK